MFRILPLLAAFLMASPVHAGIIESTLDSPSESGRISMGEGGASCNKLETVTSPRRQGTHAFKHTVLSCGERSEFEESKTVIGGTYWYGWSVYIPTTFVNSTQSYDILMQLATYPNVVDFKPACGGNGTKMSIGGDRLRVDFQYQGATKPVQCDQYFIADIDDLKGQWVDFVMHAKWTGNTDGFFKLYMKVGNGPYVQKIDYYGRTFWNNEGRGPYFKMGLYKGDPNWAGPGSPRVVYTDSYRMGDSFSNFDEVSPP